METTAGGPATAIQPAGTLADMRDQHTPIVTEWCLQWSFAHAMAACEPLCGTTRWGTYFIIHCAEYRSSQHIHTPAPRHARHLLVKAWKVTAHPTTGRDNCQSDTRLCRRAGVWAKLVNLLRHRSAALAAAPTEYNRTAGAPHPVPTLQTVQCSTVLTLLTTHSKVQHQ